MADFRHPNITAPTADGQLKQIKDYLYQLTNQLNYAVKTVDNEERIINLKTSAANSAGASENDKAADIFYDIKDHIIKSADIVYAYYDVITKKLEGNYAALARTPEGYDAFTEATKQWRENTPVSNTDYFKSVQSIYKVLGHDVVKDEDGNLVVEVVEGEEKKHISLEDAQLSEIRTNDFYIKTGWLDNDHTIGGIELGQVNKNGDVVTDAAFAHFTTEELAFMDSNRAKVAVIRPGALEITNIQLGRKKDDNGNLVGGAIETKDYIIDTSDGVAFLRRDN